ncbi:C40 family peptidase [Streptomyces sp. NPDC007971]|uniref:C40 family peptidase n=1 Tax=Streptomyces sp. NPDC007971 TaxID=3364799 RepID=UPI0036E0DDF8
MASHRKPRPGTALGAGVRTPALATAAITSVAVLSQTAEAVPALDGRPSPAEIEKKVDEFYRRADAAAEEQPAGRQQGKADALAEESARRPGRLAKAREGLGSFATAPDTTALLAEFPQDHFAPHRVMKRLASRVKDAAERGRTTADPDATPDVDPGVAPEASPETSAAPYDVKAAKAAVQKKLVTARDLLSRLTAQENAQPASAGQWNREEAAWQTAEQPDREEATWQTAEPTRRRARARQETGSPSTGSTGSPSTASADSSSIGSIGSRSTGSTGSTGSVGSYASRADKAVAFARAQIGKPYVSGASGPGSYDCAGLTQAAWRAAGVALPRTGRDQARAGTPVPLADLLPGDLVFFHGDSSHVGICTGDGKLVHAPTPGGCVREEPVYQWGESVVHSVVRPV